MATTRWTSSTLDTLLHKSLANSSDWSQQLRLSMLNQAQAIVALRFANVHGFEALNDTETLTTVASTAEYDLTATQATHLRVATILTPDGWPLQRKDLQLKNRYGTLQAADGQWGWYPTAPSSLSTSSPTLAVGLLPAPLTAGRSFTVHTIKRPRDLVISPSGSANVSMLPPAADVEILRVAQTLAKSVTPGAIDEAKKVAQLLGDAMMGTELGNQPSIEHKSEFGVSFWDAYEGLGA